MTNNKQHTRKKTAHFCEGYNQIHIVTINIEGAKDPRDENERSRMIKRRGSRFELIIEQISLSQYLTGTRAVTL